MNKNILSNRWVKLGISVLTAAYLIFIGLLSWWTFLYEIRFNSEKAFGAIYIISSLFFLVLMLYSRKQLPTRIIAMILPLPAFLLILFNFSRPLIFIPPLVVSLIIFFSCSAKESTKVIMGTIYILLYVVGIVVFIIATALFRGSSVETKINSSAPSEVTSQYDMAAIDNLNAMSVSPDGKYRYYIVDVVDNARGKVMIVVEPNDLDVTYRYFTLVEVGYSSRVAIHNARGVTPDIRWTSNDTISYTFGDGEWRTTTITPMTEKNYLRFLSIGN